MKTDEEILNDYIQPYEIEGLNEDQIKQYKEWVKTESGYFGFHLAFVRLKEAYETNTTPLQRFLYKLVGRVNRLIETK